MSEKLLLRRLTIAFGLIVAFISILAIFTAHFGITLFSSVNQNYRTMALSAALIWIFIGSVLAYQVAQPLRRISLRVVQAFLVLIAAIEAIEFIFSVRGSHSFIETLFVRAGTVVLGPTSSPISPVAAGLIVLAAIALVFVLRVKDLPGHSSRTADAISIAGIAISVISFTFVMSYFYGNPLLYGTQFIPIAFLSAFASIFAGAALVAAAGPGAVPVRYIIGNSTSAGLLRVFVPLVVGIILIENIMFVGLSSWFDVRDAVLLSTTLVIFILVTAFVVARVSGAMGRRLERAEQELVRKNEDLGAMNEELTAIEEELRQANEGLLANERQLLQKNEDLNAVNEELTATHDELHQNIEELSLREEELIRSEADLRDALAEKEVLLSEIHHRVKNNLTAFISLLSLDGSYEDTEAGRALKKDLQNRARSMALIHETLYRTGKFSNVDMEVYLNNLVGQLASSYKENANVRIVVDVHGVALDVARATTAGLIINELVNNSFKYAFPPGFDCMAVRGESCTIRVSLAHEDGTDVLTVADNGRGLPERFDPLATKSFGLKLVTFLARHQLRAEIGIRTEKGTEFSFHLKNTGG
ncbi:sensor histidine kinase [Methanoregula sp.]|uniref:sensor histidine kinase n=1 Tax=Methanoregula sp. TaxID=2052170 RepID=UPI002CC3B7F1|nr:histidine kinase dimerization/phosphoacceptor domain -containing protein [Methanoregula sp.]HVP96086.1 histidine kinase dimerization/phosphoacceptor domain -containing protein [Methanoregula sp.]